MISTDCQSVIPIAANEPLIEIVSGWDLEKRIAELSAIGRRLTRMDIIANGVYRIRAEWFPEKLRK